jgi:hypothetical protein
MTCTDNRQLKYKTSYTTPYTFRLPAAAKGFYPDKQLKLASSGMALGFYQKSYLFLELDESEPRKFYREYTHVTLTDYFMLVKCGNPGYAGTVKHDDEVYLRPVSNKDGKTPYGDVAQMLKEAVGTMPYDTSFKTCKFKLEYATFTNYSRPYSAVGPAGNPFRHRSFMLRV